VVLKRSASPVSAAYRDCWRLASTHYENFTVGSWLLPRRLRRHLAAIYAFARTADDIADEGDRPAAERLAQLDAWEHALHACYAGQPEGPVFVALADTVGRFDIPIDPFTKLLAAFRQDVTFRPFPTFAALREYCRHSADPVGHLILYLFGYRDAHRQALADQICTGLQLANFWQDLSRDVARGRLYLPLDELAQFGCAPDDVRPGPRSEALARLLAFQVDRARALLHAGLRLAACVDTRLAREVRLFAWGGLTVLQQIEAGGYDVLRVRPVVSTWQKTQLVGYALRGRTPAVAAPAAAGDAAPGAAELRAAYRYCEAVTRRSSSNFYYAFRLLPPERRQALCAVYAFCRFIDDIADARVRRAPAALLASWRAELTRVYDGDATHPIGLALADAVRRFPIVPAHFADLIRGVERDLTCRRYATFDELYEYCYLVASTVGLICIEIFGYRNAGARQYAIDLGVAFQLTNILRDVMEDAQRDRIYLPAEDLRRFDCTEADLLGGRYSPRVGALMAFECGRARAYYLRARAALAAEDQSSLAPAEAMRLIYERLLRRIEARHFNVFGPKVTLPRYEKVTLALAAWGRSQLAAWAS
jgi:phytoene synthase